MEYLSQRGVAFTEKNIREDPAALRELIEGGFSMTPVIRIGDETIAGFDPNRLEAALREESG
jgi:glutaredoxin